VGAVGGRRRGKREELECALEVDVLPEEASSRWFCGGPRVSVELEIDIDGVRLLLPALAGAEVEAREASPLAMPIRAG
jgi:hypothetical protein